MSPPAASTAATAVTSTQPLRTLTREGTFNTIRVDDPAFHLSDLYHFLMVAPWSLFLSLVVGVYLTTNLLFAGLYRLGGDCIINARPGSFADAFFFSVQTLATIGYGTMGPGTTYAHVLVTVEALLGLLVAAMSTGLMFAKFARPTARVQFSKVALITPRNGKPHLVFRVANVRGNQIVEATLRVILMRFEMTAEGERLRRLIDLPLVRSQNPIFALSWTVMHEIDAQSPLHGLPLQALREDRAELLVTMVGIDGTFAQTIHARHSYTMDELIPDARFVDLIQELPDGRRGVDLRLLSDHVPLEAAPKAEAAAA